MSLQVSSESPVGVAHTRVEAAPVAMRGPGAGAELTVVVPTYNECDNVELLFARLEAALAGTAWEVIFVDDDSGQHRCRSASRNCRLSSPSASAARASSTA
jgi:hypothetical protein